MNHHPTPTSSSELKANADLVRVHRAVGDLACKYTNHSIHTDSHSKSCFVFTGVVAAFVKAKVDT
jgi:hypothetical protein